MDDQRGGYLSAQVVKRLFSGPEGPLRDQVSERNLMET
jgi:hypothetical protein